MSEKKLQTKIRNYLKKTYPTAWIYNTCDLVQVGIPDILMLHDGNFFAFEIKIKGGVEAPMQRYQIKRIIEAGGKAGFCYSLDDVKRVIKGEK